MNERRNPTALEVGSLSHISCRKPSLKKHRGTTLKVGTDCGQGRCVLISESQINVFSKALGGLSLSFLKPPTIQAAR